MQNMIKRIFRPNRVSVTAEVWNDYQSLCNFHDVDVVHWTADEEYHIWNQVWPGVADLEGAIEDPDEKGDFIVKTKVLWPNLAEFIEENYGTIDLIDLRGG